MNYVKNTQKLMQKNDKIKSYPACTQPFQLGHMPQILSQLSKSALFFCQKHWVKLCITCIAGWQGSPSMKH